MTYKIPEYTDWLKKQNKHQPTLDYAREIRSAIIDLEGNKYLEIGNAWGVSTIVILDTLDGFLTSVDKDSNSRVYDQVKASPYASRFEWRLMDSHKFWEQDNDQYDLVYIDGSHKYEQAKEDMQEGWKRLKKGGYLLADDYCHPANNKADDRTKTHAKYGVSLSVCELIRENAPKIIYAGEHVIGFRK